MILKEKKTNFNVANKKKYCPMGSVGGSLSGILISSQIAIAFELDIMQRQITRL